jgi:hypothetical protein
MMNRKSLSVMLALVGALAAAVSLGATPAAASPAASSTATVASPDEAQRGRGDWYFYGEFISESDCNVWGVAYILPWGRFDAFRCIYQPTTNYWDLWLRQK